jgi:glutamine---fructose-6-phosphate transaminase (isomerizing)
MPVFLILDGLPTVNLLPSIAILTGHTTKHVADCRSDPKAEFVVVHNGIITNYRELKAVLQNKGYVFETETDTECIAKLAKYIFDQQKGNIDFSQLAKLVVRELEGAYALLFKSVHYPNEIVATRKGSPLLIGVKTEKKLKVDFVDVEFGALENSEQAPRTIPAPQC